MTTASEAGQQLLDAIRQKDARGTYDKVQQYKENMKNITVGSDFVMWISEPANLTKVHQALATDLGVPPRAMAIKRIVMNRTQRALLLLQAMENGIKRTHNL
jgi:hypothetical protein